MFSNNRNRLILPLAFLITMLCASICSAQTVQVKETLPDKSKVITIDGIEYRAFTADQIRDQARDKSDAEKVRQERDLLKQENDAYKRAVEAALLKVELAGTQVKLAESERDRYKAMFEIADRIARKGKVTEFFDHPVVQVLTKIGWQGVQTWLSARR